MIKAVIFDLNGVFIKSAKLSDRFEEKFGTPTVDFTLALKDIMPKVRKPNAGDAFDYWKPYLEKWNVNLTREDFFDFWFSAEKEAPEMVNLLKELKSKGLKVFILSNNFIERANYYDRSFPFLNELFNKVYYSWQTGFTKPNIEAYQNVLKENNLKPEEVAYFDDSEENVEVAGALGIKSFVFKSEEDTQKIVFNLAGL